MTTVIALHGFTRGPQHLVAFAEACQRRGWNCVRPALAPRWMPVLMNSRRHLDSIADRLVSSSRLTDPVVIVGHSAGAAAGSWMAARLVGQGIDLRGLVYVDGNDSPNHLIERSWAQLDAVPIRAFMAPPSPCNRGGRLAEFLESRRPGSVQIIEGAGHGDIEMSPSVVYRRACGDSSGPAEWRAVQRSVLDCVAQLCD